MHRQRNRRIISHRLYLVIAVLISVAVVFGANIVPARAVGQIVPVPSTSEIATSGEDYTTGTGRLSNHTLLSGDNDTVASALTVEASSTTKFTSHVGLQNKSGYSHVAKKVWLGYRITVPQNTPSGGTIKPATGFAKDLETGSKAAEAVDDGQGNWVVEGRILADGGANNILPGEFSTSPEINVNEAVQGESFSIK